MFILLRRKSHTIIFYIAYKDTVNNNLNVDFLIYILMIKLMIFCHVSLPLILQGNSI